MSDRVALTKRTFVAPKVHTFLKVFQLYHVLGIEFTNRNSRKYSQLVSTSHVLFERKLRWQGAQHDRTSVQYLVLDMTVFMGERMLSHIELPVIVDCREIIQMDVHPSVTNHEHYPLNMQDRPRMVLLLKYGCSPSP